MLMVLTVPATETVTVAVACTGDGFPEKEIVGATVYPAPIVAPVPVDSGNNNPGNGGSCSYNVNYDWGCSEWTECIDGVQTRTCKAKNNCANTYGRPDVEQTCTVVLEEEEGQEETEETIENSGFFAGITGAVVGAVGKTGGVIIAVFAGVILVGFGIVGIRKKFRK